MEFEAQKAARAAKQQQQQTVGPAQLSGGTGSGEPKRRAWMPDWGAFLGGAKSGVTPPASPANKQRSNGQQPRPSVEGVPAQTLVLNAVTESGQQAEWTLLNVTMAEYISDNLPVSLRIPGAVEWVLRYSPKTHGTSINTLYRQMEDYNKSVVIIQDSERRVFGGFAPEAWAPRGKFFGAGSLAGEALVFSFDSAAAAETLEMQQWSWTGNNHYIMYGDANCIAMGGGDGRHAWAVQSDLLRGSSAPTTTFNNPVLATSEEFVVRDIEVWALVEINWQQRLAAASKG